MVLPCCSLDAQKRFAAGIHADACMTIHRLAGTRAPLGDASASFRAAAARLGRGPLLAWRLWDLAVLLRAAGWPAKDPGAEGPDDGTPSLAVVRLLGRISRALPSNPIVSPQSMRKIQKLSRKLQNGCKIFLGKKIKTITTNMRYPDADHILFQRACASMLARPVAGEPTVSRCRRLS
jgi:hypothetical protein